MKQNLQAHRIWEIIEVAGALYPFVLGPHVFIIVSYSRVQVSRHLSFVQVLGDGLDTVQWLTFAESILLKRDAIRPMMNA